MRSLEDLMLLRRILTGFDHYKKKLEITDDLRRIFEEIRLKSLSRKKGKPILSFSDFMYTYATLPLKKLIPFDNTKDEEIRYYHHCVLTNHVGEINDEIKHFLEDHNSLEDMQQKEWIQVLDYLHNKDKRSIEVRQRDYNLIRVENLTRKPFMKENEYIDLIRKLIDQLTLLNFIKNAYVDYELREAVICSNCQYPMEQLPSGRYQCVGNHFCKHFSPISTKINTRKTKYKMLHKGFYLYTTLPGLYELKVEEELKAKGYQVIRHPNLERSGDLKVVLRRRSVYLDCKMHQSDRKLFMRLQEDEKARYIDFYVLPSFLYKNDYKRRLDGLNKKHGYPYTFVNEKKLVSILKEMN